MSPRNAHTKTAEGALAELIGQRLRAARKATGLSLKDVETVTVGAFKASVVGAYERGDRHISAARLALLAGILQDTAANVIGTL